ncbi:MAG: ROK family glucokinase [Ruminococcaceae bacterium]|nr:ROK family glucokinase [Oscillospiraceae bacterium]
MRYGFGIDLGGTTVKLAFFEENGACLDKWEIPTVKENSGEQILPDIAAAVLAYIAQKQLKKEDVLGIGIGVPGAADPNGVVPVCVNLGWGRKDVPKELGALTGLPVACGNDANLAALGECWKGAGNDNMVFVTLGTGVGGGVITEGRVLTGINGAGGEIGHITLFPDETIPCNCGKCGCAEQYLSATGIVRLANEALALPHEPSVLDRGNITAKAIFDAGKDGDPVAKAVLDRYFDIMGWFLAIICCMVNPDVIVLGGGVSKAGQMLIDGIWEPMQKHTFAPCRNVHLAIASLENDAGIYGAFKLALQNFA